MQNFHDWFQYWILGFGYRLQNAPGHVKRVPTYLKWRWQRMTRGWADCDTWGLDEYLNNVISGSVEYLRTHRHGYPSTLCSVNEDGSVAQDDKGDEKWDAILKEIVEGFKEIKRIEELDYAEWKIEHEVAERKFERSMDLLKEYFHNLWD